MKRIFCCLVLSFSLGLSDEAEPPTLKEQWKLFFEAIHADDLDAIRKGLSAGLDPNDGSHLMQAPLMVALRDSHHECAKILIEAGADVRTGRSWLDTPLHVCKDPEIIDMLLERGADLNARDDSANTPLMTAIRFDAPEEVIQRLIDRGANINAASSSGYTPLHLSILGKNEKMFHFLAERGADLFAVTNSGENAMDIAIWMNLPAVVPYLFEHGFSPNALSRGGGTLLHETRWDDLEEILDLFLQAGADLSIKEPCYGDTPLHRAVRNNSLNTVEKLVKAGANVNAINFSGSSPLHYAIDYEKEPIAQLLLENGAHIDPINLSGQTPLLLAVYEGDKDLVELFLKSGANPHVVDYAGLGLLHQLSFPTETFDGIAIAKLLLKSGVDLEKPDSRGWTPLQWAVDRHQSQLVSLLVEAGVNVNTKDQSFETPLLRLSQQMQGYGYSNKTKQIAIALIQKGADINAQDPRTGMTPLHYLAENGSWPLIKLFLELGADPHIQDNEGRSPLNIVEKSNNKRAIAIFQKGQNLIN